VCLKKAKYVLATVAMLGIFLPASAVISVASTATADETMPIGQKYYQPSQPQDWSEIAMAVEQARIRKAREARYGSLQNFLAGYGSPLSSYSRDFIDAGDKYGVDYRVVVAIAGREQTFGVAWPGSSNNLWGYGGYRWPDVPTAINEYTRHLSDEYPGLSRGDIYGSAARYAASPTWASGVTEFYSQLQKACP
jgi:hypothetical protein